MNRLASLLLLCTAIFHAPLEAAPRTITNQDGASLEVELEKLEDKNGVETLYFKRVSDDRSFDIALSSLSFDDQREIRKWWEKELIAKSILRANVDLDITFIRNRRKSNLTNSSYYDYNQYSYTPEVRIENDDLYQTYRDNLVRIVCFAQHTYYKGNLQVVSVTEKKIDLPRNGTATMEGNSYSFTNDKSEYSDYEYGWEDAGYVVIIKNSKGEITHTKTDNDNLLRELDTVLKCKTDEYYASDLSRRRSSYSDR